MPQSLVKNYIHITFSTKNRYPFIDNSIKNELFNYLGGICRNKECNPVIVGGHNDHIHILCLLSRKVALMDLIEALKTHTSKWIKTKGKDYEKFYWQRGYGAFSVHYTLTDVVKHSIESQEKHHKNKSFKEEYLVFLKESEIDYDDRYVWD